MKRFWLLLLAFVLPLQMSWAAVHFCDAEEAPAAVMHEQGHSGDHATAHDPAPADQAGASHDNCCTNAHGCHGLHTLMGPAAALDVRAGGSQAVLAAPRGLHQADARDRIERPRWSAA